MSKPIKKVSHKYRDLLIKKGKISHELDFEKIDYEKINPMRNKINVMSFKSDISQGYSKESNREILKGIDGVDRLQTMYSKLLKLPLVNERKIIFNELITLYKKRLWYGFYALGLPQVEGIFSEMLKIAQPTEKQSTLSDKVNAVRPFIENSEYAFDYYKYFLPNQRNKFTHSGHDQDIELIKKRSEIFIFLSNFKFHGDLPLGWYYNITNHPPRKKPYWTYFGGFILTKSATNGFKSTGYYFKRYPSISPLLLLSIASFIFNSNIRLANKERLLYNNLFIDDCLVAF